MTISTRFTIFSLWAVALFSSVSQAQPVPRWEPAAPAGVARQELYPEVLDGKMYVAGGLLSPNTGYSAHFDGSPYKPTHRDGGLLLAPDAGSWHAARRVLMGELAPQ